MNSADSAKRFDHANQQAASVSCELAGLIHTIQIICSALRALPDGNNGAHPGLRNNAAYTMYSVEFAK